MVMAVQTILLQDQEL